MERLKLVENKIYTFTSLIQIVAAWRIRSDKIIFTNGCFDLLHLGHITYLAQAASMGSRLVIGLNSDTSVRLQNKGIGRPIQSEVTRSMVLASLQFVDAVCLFNEETPVELIRSIKPDILVKGSDWSVENIAGSDIVLANGGKVEIIPLIEGYSTTAIEEKIRDGQN